MAPATTGSGSSAIEIARSATGVTDVVALALSLPLAGSAVPLSITDVVVNVPPVTGAVVPIAIVDELLAASDARVQVTTCPDVAHDQPLAVTLVIEAAASTAAVTVTVLAALGPALPTVIV